jgi:hypothetical protein
VQSFSGQSRGGRTHDHTLLSHLRLLDSLSVDSYDLQGLPGGYNWDYGELDENWHNRATTSGGEYSITTEDGRVRPKHVLIEFKK